MMAGERKTMRPTLLTSTELAIVGMIATSVEAMLLMERVAGNSRWFSVEDIYHGEQRPPLIPFLAAMTELAATGNIEGDVEGRMRHA